MMNYSAIGSFSFAPFSPEIRDNFTSLDQFLYFTDNFMMESFEGIFTKNAFGIMKVAYRDLKPNVVIDRLTL